MKTHIRTIATILSLSLLAQCTTMPDGKQVFDVKKAILVADATVPSVVRSAAASKDPKIAGYLRDVALVIDTFAAGKDLDATTFVAAIESINTEALKNDTVQTVIDVVVSLYKATYADVVQAKIDKSASLVPFLKAISANIKKGLGK